MAILEAYYFDYCLLITNQKSLMLCLELGIGLDSNMSKNYIDSKIGNLNKEVTQPTSSDDSQSKKWTNWHIMNS